MYFIMIYGPTEREPLIPLVTGNEHLDVIVATFPTYAEAEKMAESNGFAVANGFEIFTTDRPAHD